MIKIYKARRNMFEVNTKLFTKASNTISDLK